MPAVSKYKSIVIDDDEISNMLFQISIKDLKIDSELDFFLKPTDAIDYLTSIKDPAMKPNALFIDINMPLISGWKVIETLDEKGFFEGGVAIYVAILSSSISSKDKQRATENKHVSEFISKPISLMKLKNIYTKIGEENLPHLS